MGRPPTHLTEFAHKAHNGHCPLRAASAIIPTKMLMGERRGYCNFGAVQRLPMELLISQAFDASKSLIALDQDSTIIVVIEMSQSKCRGTRCARWCVRERPR